MYPYLYFQMMSEFCQITGVDENTLSDKWERCHKSIRKYAPLEQKKSVKSLLQDIKIIDGEN